MATDDELDRRLTATTRAAIALIETTIDPTAEFAAFERRREGEAVIGLRATAPVARRRTARTIAALAAAALVVAMVPVLWFTRESPSPTDPVTTIGPVGPPDPVIGVQHIGTDPVPFPTGMASGFQGYSASADDLTDTSLTVRSSLDMETQLVLTWDPQRARTVPDNTIGLDSRFVTDPPSVQPTGVRFGPDEPGTAVLTITGEPFDDVLTGADKNTRLAREEIQTLVNSIVFLDRPTAEQALSTTPDVIRDTFELDGVAITRQIGLPTSAVQVQLGPDGRSNGAALSILRDNLGIVAKQLLTLADGRIVISHSPLYQPLQSTGAVTVDDALLGLSWTLVDAGVLRDNDGEQILDVVDTDGNTTTISVVNYDTD
jgi:hypothetical protein